MPHKHFCDIGGHEWECGGAALRPLRGNTEPTPCYCPSHRVLMEDGDHSQCVMELLACEEHRDAQLLAMGYRPGQEAVPPAAEHERSSMFKDERGNPIVGFCLWCDRDFYTIDEAYAHNADGMAACAVAQELKDQPGMPPVLQMMFQNAGLLPEDGADDQE